MKKSSILYRSAKRAIHQIAPLFFSLALILGMAPMPSLAAVDAVPASQPEPISQDWFATVQDNLRREEYHITWQDTTYLADLPAAYQAPNRAHNLRTYFTPDGIAVIPRVLPEGAENLPWRWQAGLTAWGRAEALAHLGPASLQTAENIITYQRSDPAAIGALQIEEAFRNDEEGIAQIFTIQAPPDGTGAGLQFEIKMNTDLLAEITQQGAALDLKDQEGTTQLRYSLMHARDAARVSLSGELILNGSSLTIQVDDTTASYPIEVLMSITGLPTSPNWSVGLGQGGASCGYSVATAGDTNGDGYSDVIVGAPYWDGGLTDEGRADVYPGWATGLSVIPIWTKEGDQANAHFGWSVATAGDVNGDGYADIIVGAPDYDHGQTNEGGAWVYEGTASGPHDAPDNFDEGSQDNARFGYSVAFAGDVNNDGYADIIVGAPYYDAGQTDEGRAWVWHGSASGVSSLNNFKAESNQTNGKFGISVATAGDVNGDGYADIIVGMIGYANGQTDEGSAFAWYGSGSGVHLGLDGDLTNEYWHTQEVNETGAQLGISVSTAGDVNGDGYADVIVGANTYNGGTTDQGLVDVYLGTDSGLSDTRQRRLLGGSVDAWFGFSVGAAGDVNGDGFGDIIIGSPLYENAQTEEGRALVYLGTWDGIGATDYWKVEGNGNYAHYGNSVFTAGDVNADGYSDVIIGAPGRHDHADVGFADVFHGSPDAPEETASWAKVSNNDLSYFGYSVASAGDVNGDGYGDVIVGAPYWDDGQAFEGGAWVYLGWYSGLLTAPDWYEQLNVANIQFGFSVSGAGDVNGDGYDDVIVGAPYYDSPQVDEGAAFVYLGSSTGLSNSSNWSKASDDAGAMFGYSVSSAGDVNGDGYADVIVGAPFWSDEGGAWVYLGSPDGAISKPHWYTKNDQEDSEYGTAVGTAGDVNRDGYSDVIVGAPRWDNGQTNEGGVYVYLGSPGGLSTKYSWRQDSDKALALYGSSVGTAGDVNGDGFSDFIVGAPYYNGGLDGEGKAYVYLGAAGSMSLSPVWEKESNQLSAKYGTSVSTAGDVNGDGYADIIVGANLWDGGEPGEMQEGGAWIYLGKSTGVNSAPAWYTQGGQGTAHFGFSVSSAGDVNGDGYADVVVGAPMFTNSLTDEGKVFVFYGNGGRGVHILPIPMDVNSFTPIPRLGRSDRHDTLRGHLAIQSPFGRGSYALEAEAQLFGLRFNANNTTAWAFWQDYPIHYVGYITLSGLETNTLYHFRIRWRYNPATTPWMPASRWLTQPWNGWQEADLRTGGGRLFVPVIKKSVP
ncbi:MAG: FG-GAP repeat protein [Anaerolineales bacterium]|nr:FG-GAP repeat protein [Anaerolineales bacterium]